MPSIPRRVVTGHDASGRSVFASDDPVPAAYATPGGTLFYELWATDATPAPVDAAPSALADGPVSVTPARNGTKLRVNEIPPGGGSPMHRTRTVDYGIVLDGEVVLVLDDGETVLRARGRRCAAGHEPPLGEPLGHARPGGVHPDRRRVIPSARPGFPLIWR